MSIGRTICRRGLATALAHLLCLAGAAASVSGGQEFAGTSLRPNSQGETSLAGKARLPGYLSPSLVALFVPDQYVIDNGKGQRRVYQYRLFKPTRGSGDADRFYPLLVWLHGHGFDELEYENLGQLKHLESLIFRRPEGPRDYPFFCLAVQCPKDAPDWCSAPANGVDVGFLCPVEAVVDIVDRLSKDEPIDANRILLTGVSSGALACWELAIRYPDRFAAVAPLAGVGGADLARVDKLVDVPVWAFHSDHDSPEQVRQTVAKLQAAGGRCCLTEVPSNRHDCWTAAFRDYGLLRWLLRQKRGVVDVPRPGALDSAARWRLFCRDYVLPWRKTDYWLPRAMLVAVLLGCVYGWHRTKSLKRSSRNGSG
jgi:predicted esterase